MAKKSQWFPVDANDVLQTAGDGLAAGTTDTGTSTKIGGIYETTPATITNGQRGELHMDSTQGAIVNPKPLSQSIDAITNYVKGNSFSNITSSATVYTGSAVLIGMYVNSTSSGTIKIYDNSAQSGTVANNTITPAIGWHSLGNALLATGLAVTIGGTLDVTLYYLAIS